MAYETWNDNILFSFFMFWFRIDWSPQNENCLNDSFLTLQNDV
jgi:hypothetical protein